jgi:lysophospholipase L1-like esterase
LQATSLSEQRVIQCYVALGDSFTAGAPASDHDARWPDELAAALRGSNRELEYHNLGAVGATTAQVAACQLDSCIELGPDLVSVVCGANDVLLSVRPDIDAHAAALDLIFDTIRVTLPRTIVVTATTPLVAGHMPLRPRTRTRVERGVLALNEVTRSIAGRHGVLCLEFAEHPTARRRDNFAGDGFHPSATGVRRAALACAQALASQYAIAMTGEEENV